VGVQGGGGGGGGGVLASPREVKDRPKKIRLTNDHTFSTFRIAISATFMLLASVDFMKRFN
jgi:hypothetical protein